jgi:hypothetical protein
MIAVSSRACGVEKRLGAAGALLALTSLAALVAHVLGMLPMVFFLTFFGVPSVLLLFAMAALARMIDARVLLNSLAVGFAGGLIGTIVYDLFRYLVRLTHIFSYDGFTAIYIFGSWISGRPPASAEAAWAGWIYHFWNGLSFGVFYALTFGRRPWLFGVAYGVMMELCMLGLFPLFIIVSSKVDFVVISLIGHLLYGAGLGLVVQRYAVRPEGVR